MERIRIIWILAIMTMVTTSKEMAQSPLPDTILLGSPVFREKIHLFTDRDLYAVNEKILFRAINNSDPELKKQEWSKVLYVELVNGLNSPVRQAKFPLHEYGAWGYMDIPDTLSTGIFYLRAYTKWMRNFDPSGYFHTSLWIVNPEKPPRLTATAPSGPQVSYYTGDQQGNDAIRCVTDKKSYARREKVSLKLKSEHKELESVPEFCLTVTKKDYLGTGPCSITESPTFSSQDDKVVRFIPETRGLTVTGEILDQSAGIPAPYSSAHLTLLGDQPDCFGFRTNHSGNFFLAMPEHFGSQDILIIVNEDDPVQVRLDDDFSTDFIKLQEMDCPDPPGWIASMEEIMIHMQIKQAFANAPGDTIPAAREDKIPLSFYGQPVRRLWTSDYIRLPNLEEFFFELIPEVILRRNGRERSFAIPPQTHLEPLVLLDHVVVYNAETILDIPPERIRYIDVVNEIYIRGDNYYGGIVNILSQDGDRGEIELPGNSFIFSYRSFEPQEEITFPVYDENPGNTRIPDVRNTLFWLPNIDLSHQSDTTVFFYTSDIPGEYTVNLRGIDRDGELVHTQCNFRIE